MSIFPTPIGGCVGVTTYLTIPITIFTKCHFRGLWQSATFTSCVTPWANYDYPDNNEQQACTQLWGQIIRISRWSAMGWWAARMMGNDHYNLCHRTTSLENCFCIPTAESHKSWGRRNGSTNPIFDWVPMMNCAAKSCVDKILGTTATTA